MPGPSMLPALAGRSCPSRAQTGRGTCQHPRTRAVEAQLSQTLVHWAEQASERLNLPWDVQVMRPVPDAAQRAWLGADELLVALDPATNRLLRYEPCKLRSVLCPSLRMKLHPQPADRGAEGRGQDLGASVGRC